MLKRLRIYFKERYPLLARFVLGGIVFLEIYFIILLNNDITAFQLGIQELIGAYTVFAFLMWLRIADDLKDYETDLRLFPDRPLPSGRVTKKDIIIICIIVQAIAVVLNLLFMNNFLFFCVVISNAPPGNGADDDSRSDKCEHAWYFACEDSHPCRVQHRLQHRDEGTSQRRAVFGCDGIKYVWYSQLEKTEKNNKHDFSSGDGISHNGTFRKTDQYSKTVGEKDTAHSH